MIEVSENVYGYFSSLYGEGAAKKYSDFVKEDPAQYIRVNTLKAEREELKKLLKINYGIESAEVPGVENGLKILNDTGLTGKTIEHIIGLYYIQGLSSMLPPLVLNPGEEDVVLDLCSAPGSKTTGISEMMNNKGKLIANEIQLDRVKMLVFNLDRMNIINAGVIHTKGEWLNKIFPDYFSKILVDAPCSGLGIIQKKGEVNNWWSVERANNLGELQLKLLVGAVKMAKPGGEIVYSTCTLTLEENELVLNKILNKYPVELAEITLPVKSENAFTEYEGEKLNQNISRARRILPWESDSDGFFIAKLVKVGETVPPKPANIQERDIKIVDYSNKQIKSLLKNIIAGFGITDDVLNQFNYLLKGNDLFFISKEWDNDRLGAFERIGTRFGIIDKRNEITLHTQAAQIIQQHISKNIFVIEDKDDLKKYLEGGIIKKDPGFEGQCAVKYGSRILGTAVAGSMGIKSRFPRAKRTQDIHLDF